MTASSAYMDIDAYAGCIAEAELLNLGGEEAYAPRLPLVLGQIAVWDGRNYARDKFVVIERVLVAQGDDWAMNLTGSEKSCLSWLLKGKACFTVVITSSIVVSQALSLPSQSKICHNAYRYPKK